MATKESLGIREEVAVNRIVSALEQLATEARLEPPQFEKVPKGANRQSFEVRRLETTADFLETLTVVQTEEVEVEVPKEKQNGNNKGRSRSVSGSKAKEPS